MARLAVAMGTIIGVVAALVAAGTAGAVREAAVIVSLYGAFVVVLIGAPGRRPVLRPATVRVHRRVR